jgi:flagellar hook assembly protein FlgD
MDITQTSTVSTPTATAQKKPVISSDFDTFLKMLTTQIKNLSLIHISEPTRLM